MKALQFSSNNAQRVYDDYIHRSRKMLKILSNKDKEDCLLEINSYIYEYMEEHKGTDETEKLLNIIQRLGAPEETLKEVIAAKKTSQAIKTFNPKHLAQALLLNIRNGFIYILLFLLFIMLLGFPVLIVAKIMHPEQVGLYVGPGTFAFGIADDPNTREVLGNWFIPVTIVLTAVLYFSIIFFLKIVNKKR